jgi:hypothetical protein
MELTELVNLALSLTQAVTNGANNLAQVSSVIKDVTSQGRTTLNPDEEARIRGIDDAARAYLVSELTRRISP